MAGYYLQRQQLRANTTALDDQRSALQLQAAAMADLAASTQGTLAIESEQTLRETELNFDLRITEHSDGATSSVTVSIGRNPARNLVLSAACGGMEIHRPHDYRPPAQAGEKLGFTIHQMTHPFGFLVRYTTTTGKRSRLFDYVKDVDGFWYFIERPIREVGDDQRRSTNRCDVETIVAAPLSVFVVGFAAYGAWLLSQADGIDGTFSSRFDQN